MKPRWQTGSHPRHTLESPSHTLVTPGIAPRPGSYPVHLVPSRVTTTRVTHRQHQSATRVTPNHTRSHPGHTHVTLGVCQKVTPTLHEGCAQSCLGRTNITPFCTRATPGHASVTSRFHPGYTHGMLGPRPSHEQVALGLHLDCSRCHRSYTQVTPGLHPGCTRATPRLLPGYAPVVPW